METSKIGREYHQAGVIYVCSGCETDMLDPGNGADLYLKTPPPLPLSFPCLLSPRIIACTVHWKVIYFLFTVHFFPFSFSQPLFIKAFRDPPNAQFTQTQTSSQSSGKFPSYMLTLN